VTEQERSPMTGPTPANPAGRRASDRSLRATMLALAVACGAAVANIYYAQPLLAAIARSFSISRGSASLIVTATQVGYALGLALLLPIGDLVQSRRLVSRILVVTTGALVLACVAPGFQVLLAASVLIGLTSIIAQILLPLAAELAPDESRGRYVGMVTSGLLLGIMLARSVSSLAAAVLGWRSIFGISAGLMLLLAAVLWRVLPEIAPSHRAGYRSLLRSTVAIAREEPVLRSRALAQGLMFATFTTFWTAIAYELSDRHGFGQAAIALFALVGAAGATSAPLIGRLGDAGHGPLGRLLGFALAAGAMVLAAVGASSVIMLAIAAIVLDVGAQFHYVLSMRDIYTLRPESRARINSVFMTTMFLSGAAASALTGVVFSRWGWTSVCVFAVAEAALGAGVWAVTTARSWTIKSRRKPCPCVGVSGP
jgi:predicted MFS family arabinose efflux permease